MADLSRGCIPINLADHMDIDKDLINAYLYLYPVKLSSKVTATSTIGTKALQNAEADKTPLNTLLALTRTFQTNLNNITTIESDMKKIASNSLSNINDSLPSPDVSYPSDTLQIIDDVRSLLLDKDGNDLKSMLLVVNYMKGKYTAAYNSTSLEQKVLDIQAEISSFYAKYVQKSASYSDSNINSGRTLINNHNNTMRQFLTALNNISLFSSTTTETIIKNYIGMLKSYSSSDPTTNVSKFFDAIRTFYRDSIAKSVLTASDIQQIISITNTYYVSYLSVIGNYVSSSGTLLETGPIAVIRGELKGSYKAKFGAIKFKSATIKSDLQKYVNSLNGNQAFDSIISYITDLQTTNDATQTNEDNSKDKTIKKAFTNFYFVFPILDTKLEQKYSFSWQEFEYGQMNPGQFIQGTIGKSALKIAGEATKAVANSKAVNALTGGVSGGLETVKEKVLSEVESLASNENLQNALQQQAGVAFIKPKKKIFKGTNYMTHDYKVENITPKSKMDHLEIMRILKLFKALIMPTQSSGDIVSLFADVLAGGLLGGVGKTLGADVRNKLPKMSDTVKVMTDLYLYTMSYPMTFRGIVKTKGNTELGIRPLTVKFFPEAGVSDFTSAVDLTMAFYEDTNLPATISFSINFEELVPFHAGISMFSPESNGDTIPDAMEALNSNDLNTKLSVYEKTFSIL